MLQCPYIHILERIIMKVACLDRDGTINQSYWTRREDGYTEYFFIG